MTLPWRRLLSHFRSQLCTGTNISIWFKPKFFQAKLSIWELPVFSWISFLNQGWFNWQRKFTCYQGQGQQEQMISSVNKLSKVYCALKSSATFRHSSLTKKGDRRRGKGSGQSVWLSRVNTDFVGRPGSSGPASRRLIEVFLDALEEMGLSHYLVDMLKERYTYRSAISRPDPRYQLWTAGTPIHLKHLDPGSLDDLFFKGASKPVKTWDLRPIVDLSFLVKFFVQFLNGHSRTGQSFPSRRPMVNIHRPQGRVLLRSDTPK